MDPDSLTCAWSLDERPVAGDSASLDLATEGIPAGTHAVKVALVKGNARASLSWRLQVAAEPPRNRGPRILQALPPGDVAVPRGGRAAFSALAHDVDAGDSVRHRWRLDGEVVSDQGDSLEVETSRLDPGDHVVTVNLTDGIDRQEEPPERSWRLQVLEPRAPAPPYLAAAWPAGSLRLERRSRLEFEVAAFGAAAEGRAAYRWEVNGRLQEEGGPSFLLDTTSGENLLAPGPYRITCSLEEGQGARSSGRAAVGWTVHLDPQEILSAPTAGAAANLPPVAEALLPEGAVYVPSGESEAFQVKAWDPDGDILSYRWVVDGVPQEIDGPILTYTAPAGSRSLRVEVSADDGHAHGAAREPRGETWLGSWEVSVAPSSSRALIFPGGAVVIDNGRPGTSTTGLWLTSRATGPYGTDSLYSRASGATYAYDVPVPAAGLHDVYLRWTSWPSRSGRVPVAVRHAGGAASLTVDQRVNGSRWNRLGTFQLGSSTRLVITSEGGDYSTCADAACIVPAGTGPAPEDPAPAGVDLIIDDGDPGAAPEGTWTVSSGPSPYGGRSLYAKNAGSYTFGRSIASPGTYDVFAWWTEWPSRDPAAPYSILHAGGTAVVTVDQRTGGGAWRLLGRYAFGPRVAVELGVPGAASVCADAVRFVPAAGGEPPPVSVPAAGSLTLSWQAPAHSADGTPLTDLGGHKVYVQIGSAGYIPLADVGLRTQYTADGLTRGTYTFAVTAYDTSGNESTLSNAVTVTIP